MKRITMLLALVVSLMMVVAVVPAAAKKPPKPPKPPSAVPVAVSMDAQPLWVHEGDDHLRYTVTLENKTGAAISVTGEFTAAVDDNGPKVDLIAVEIPANATVMLDGFSRYAWEFTETAECHTRCELPASVAIYDVDGELMTEQTMSTTLYPEPSCEFDLNGQASVDGVCIWTLPTTITELDESGEPVEIAYGTGVWEITLSPTPPDNRKKPISATVTVRDGVPGNWCTVAIGTGSMIGGRWRAEDLDPKGYVYLPGDENLPTLDVGMCLGGGAGGDYFEVGNPSSFYLAADGDMTITVRWYRELP